ncbi:MAG: glycosyltransferase [Bacteroidetes bacterium]|nr:glycosyltransferase [Bacteroidota bacterium]
MRKTRILVVIVSFNGERDIGDCLKSFESQTGSGIEIQILLIDNQSEDNTVSVARKFMNVECILNERNLGFGRAANKGLIKSIHENYDFVFLLNQDTVLEKEAIQYLVNAGINNPNCVLSPMVLNNDHQTDEEFSKAGITDSTKSLNFIPAIAWFLPTDIIRKTGGFDPFFFHYGEDHNYCDRLLLLGFGLKVVTEPVIIHKSSPSTLRNNKTKHEAYLKRNLLNPLSDQNLWLTRIIYDRITGKLSGTGFRHLITFYFKNYSSIKNRKNLYRQSPFLD